MLVVISKITQMRIQGEQEVHLMVYKPLVKWLSQFSRELRHRLALFMVRQQMQNQLQLKMQTWIKVIWTWEIQVTMMRNL